MGSARYPAAGGRRYRTAGKQANLRELRKSKSRSPQRVLHGTTRGGKPAVRARSWGRSRVLDFFHPEPPRQPQARGVREASRASVRPRRAASVPAPMAECERSFRQRPGATGKAHARCVPPLSFGGPAGTGGIFPLLLPRSPEINPKWERAKPRKRTKPTGE
jgi:hypothetical protein